jgi:hypothetical protein
MRRAQLRRFEDGRCAVKAEEKSPTWVFISMHLLPSMSFGRTRFVSRGLDEDSQMQFLLFVFVLIYVLIYVFNFFPFFLSVFC